MPKKPRRVYTKAEIELIQKLSAIRLPLEQVAIMLKSNVTDLRAESKRNPEMARAFEEGRAQASTEVRVTLFEMATKKKDFRAIKFWCQTQEGFKISEKIEVTGADGRPLETKELTKDEMKARLIKLRKLNDLTDEIGE